MEKSPVYKLFLRQWLRGPNHCTEADIDEAVSKELLSMKQGEEIKGTERNAA